MATSDVQAIARLAAQLRADYAWLLAQIDVYGGRWQEHLVVDGEPTTYGESIMELARNRFRYQHEDNATAFDAMRALTDGLTFE